MRIKQLKPGMSLIEVVMAIAIFAVFGSSLFMMQQYLFDRMIFAQKKVIASLRMQSQLVEYQTNILKEMFERNGLLEKSLQEQVKEFTQPDMTITIDTRSDFSVGVDATETAFKNFKNLHLISVQAEHDDKDFGKSYMFVYIHEVEKQ